MKLFLIGISFASSLIVLSCTGIPYVSKDYGEPVVYGEGKHPGIDFQISVGTPIIAAADGRVVWVGDPCSGEWWCGDRTVPGARIAE
jgi:murein DD-endopeptidase MepM/ murein hydrolase activator NlpD